MSKNKPVAKVKRTKRSKWTIGVSTSVGAISIAVAVALASNAKPKTEKNINDIMQKIDFTEGYKKLNEHCEDLIQRVKYDLNNSAYPISSCSVQSIDADESSMVLYVECDLNSSKVTEPSYVKVEVGGEDYSNCYNEDLKLYINNLNAGNVSQKETNSFFEDIINITTDNNIIELSDLYRINDEYTQQLTQQLLVDYIESNDKISEQEKTSLIQSISYTNDIEVFDSHFSTPTFEPNSRTYISEYSGIIQYNNMLIEVETEIATRKMITIDELTPLLVKQYETKPELFTMEYSQAIFNQAMIESYKQKTTSTVTSTVVTTEEELEQ